MVRVAALPLRREAIRPRGGFPELSTAATELWITFETAPERPENAPFLPFREAKTALALAPEGVSHQNVKMGKTKCAPF